MKQKNNPVKCIGVIAKMLGSCYGKCSVKCPKLKKVLVHYLIVQVLVIVVTVAYVEIGHDKGWKRADTWYTCLHTHHHFLWQ